MWLDPTIIAWDAGYQSSHVKLLLLVPGPPLRFGSGRLFARSCITSFRLFNHLLQRSSRLRTISCRIFNHFMLRSSRLSTICTRVWSVLPEIQCEAKKWPDQLVQLATISNIAIQSSKNCSCVLQLNNNGQRSKHPPLSACWNKHQENYHTKSQALTQFNTPTLPPMNSFQTDTLMKCVFRDTHTHTHTRWKNAKATCSQHETFDKELLKTTALPHVSHRLPKFQIKLLHRSSWSFHPALRGLISIFSRSFRSGTCPRHGI